VVLHVYVSGTEHCMPTCVHIYLTFLLFGLYGNVHYLKQILTDLAKDPWRVNVDQRPQRCSGVAMSVAVGMLEKLCNRRGARIMLFTGELLLRSIHQILQLAVSDFACKHGL
jgi:hypothetical protein